MLGLWKEVDRMSLSKLEEPEGMLRGAVDCGRSGGQDQRMILSGDVLSESGVHLVESALEIGVGLELSRRGANRM